MKAQKKLERRWKELWMGDALDLKCLLALTVETLKAFRMVIGYAKC